MQFDNFIGKALKRMHIPGVWRANGCGMQDQLNFFNTLIMSLLIYCARVWGVALQTKYLSQIDRIQSRTLRSGYIK